MNAKSRKRGEGCIEGFRCPKCGNYQTFKVSVRRTVIVTEDGTEDCGGDTEWEDDTWCMCGTCDHEATVGYFTDEKSA